MPIMLRVRSVDYRGSIVDGPGIRTTVYTQGCLRHCFNCHNPQTWDTQGGRLMRVEDLAEEVIRGSPTKRVTISGGEPLLQMEAVIKLAELLRSAGFEIALYTGYAKEDVPEALLDVLDYLKTGAYIDSLRTTVTPYVGSKNQLFEKVSRNGEAPNAHCEGGVRMDMTKRSEIKRFDPSGWGSILKGTQEEDGDYFYIDQVYDHTPGGLLLRQMLCLGIAKGFEVSYRLGKQVADKTHKEIAATDIELTDNGIRKAEALLSRMKTPCKGYLAYRPDERIWTLKSAEVGKKKTLYPDESTIRDPYLKQFCRQYACADEQPVTFYLDEQGAPFNICGNRSRISPEPYGVGISVDDARAWDDYERALSMLGSSQDPYPNHPFKSLAPLKEDAEAPLTWR